VLGASALPIVQDHKPACTIVVPADASAQVRGAADLLAKHAADSTGATLPVVAEPDSDASAARIHVGMTNFAERAAGHLDGLDEDGFVLLPADAKNLIVVGPSDWGTEFGVCELLETRVGVRWLLPGEHGTHVPKHANLTGPSEMMRQEPAFFSRLFSGLRGNAQSTWARRQRMRGRVSFHHNLLRLFPAETYTKTHPEFFPIHDGKRHLPANNSAHHWQPCFTAPGIVEEAVKNIKASFAKNPSAASYSLGVTDSGGHCECEACQARDPGDDNFVGMRDVSDRYFEWCNAVVTEVLKEYPDKWFGCLAYSHVAQPPRRVKVHPRIIPYMTYDRMKWALPEQQAEGHRLTEWWHKTSPTLGWYNYIYGTPYVLPRVYFHRMAENYRYAREHGVRVHYAEAYPNWGEGPKLYVSLKLQWNPDRDVDAMLRDWYVACVGEAAADDLAAYYRLWEEFWTGPALKTKWFSPKAQYLTFNSPAYLEAVEPEMIARSRKLLEAAVSQAATEDQKARAQLLLRAFEYYEASAYAYRGARRPRGRSIRTEADALDVLSDAVRTIGMAHKRVALVKAFEKHSVLVHPLPPGRYGLLSASSWGVSDFWAVYSWVETSQAVRDRLGELGKSSQPDVAGQAKTMLSLGSGKLKPISPNPGFEEGEGNTAEGWGFWVKREGALRRTKDVKRTGEWSVVAEDFQRGGPTQAVPMAPGRYLGLCYAYVPKGQASSGTVELAIVMRDAGNQNLEEAKTRIFPVPGEWTLVATQLDVTARSRGKDVAHVLFCPIINGFRKGERVYVDDCRLYRLETKPNGG